MNHRKEIRELIDEKKKHHCFEQVSILMVKYSFINF
jgi:hypothetical protein